jgi:hypothetical protein
LRQFLTSGCVTDTATCGANRISKIRSTYRFRNRDLYLTVVVRALAGMYSVTLIFAGSARLVMALLILLILVAVLHYHQQGHDA